MQILIRAPQEIKIFLQCEAKRIGITLNALVLQILWEWVKKRKLEADKETPVQERLDNSQPRK